LSSRVSASTIRGVSLLSSAAIFVIALLKVGSLKKKCWTAKNARKKTTTPTITPGMVFFVFAFAEGAEASGAGAVAIFGRAYPQEAQNFEVEGFSSPHWEHVILDIIS